MRQFTRTLPFLGGLAAVTPARNVKPVNVEWAGAGLAQRNVVVPGTRLINGQPYTSDELPVPDLTPLDAAVPVAPTARLTIDDFVDRNGVRPKHHRTAEQRARQLARTAYVKGPSK